MKQKILKLINLSRQLDLAGLYNYSSRVDHLIKKVAQEATTPAVTTAPAPAPAAASPRPTLQYIQGLHTMFGGKASDIASYEKLKKRQTQESFSENYKVRDIVEKLVQNYMQDIFSNLSCIKNKKDADFKDKTGVFSFSVEINFTKNLLRFKEKLKEEQNELTNDGTISNCLNGIFFDGKDIDDPNFTGPFKKYRAKALEKAGEQDISPDFLSPNIDYEVSINLSIKESQ